MLRSRGETLIETISWGDDLLLIGAFVEMISYYRYLDDFS